MAIDFFGIFKGLKIQKETDRTKQLILQVGASATTGTATTLEVNQTANRTVTLPDASGALITASSIDVLTNKTIDGDNNTLQDIPLSAIKTIIGNANSFVVRDGAGALSNATYTQATALLNSFVGDSGSGGTKGLVPAPVAGDATKFLRGDGTFQTVSGSGDVVGPASATDNAVTRFDGVTGKLVQNSVVTISDLGVVTGAALDNSNSVTVLDSNLTIQDNVDTTKQVQFQASSVGTGTTATLTVPPASTTLVGTTTTQVLTNKDVDGGAASNANRITLPQNTTVALAALVRKEATIAYDTTLNQVVYDDGASFQPVGSGSTPTGDADTLAFFNSAGNLSSDDTDLRYYNFTGALNPSGIVYGDITPDVAVDVLERSLVIVNGADVGSAINVSDRSVVMGEVANGGEFSVQSQSLAHGQINGVSSTIQATAASHAHGLANGPQAIIIADNQSHAFGNVSATVDARIQAFGQSLAFGSATSDFFIEAQSVSLAGGRTGAGGVQAGIASISFGEDINQGNSVNTEFAFQFGLGHTSEAPHVTKFGRYSEDVAGDGSTWVDTDPLFVLGNGLNAGAKANAFQVDKDGRITVTGGEVVPVREIAVTETISDRTDRVIILDGAGAEDVQLPPGIDGLRYTLSASAGNTATWGIIPNGADTLDGNIPADIGSLGFGITIIFLNGVWYRL